MKKKYIAYIAVPALALTLLTSGIAYAKGGGWGMGSNLTPDQIATNQQERFQNEANLLGVSVDEIKNAWAQGKNLQQLATEKGITETQLQQKLSEQRQQQMKSNLQTLVDKGVITQAQADLRLQYMQNNTQNRGKGRGMGMHMGLGL